MQILRQNLMRFFFVYFLNQKTHTYSIIYYVYNTERLKR